MAITYRQGISIGEIAVYAPCLIIAITLLFRHGISRSAGWYFLAVFSLARIIGGSLELALANDPSSVGLHIGAAILTNIGFSPLMLATLGLLSRLITNINLSTPTAITSRHTKFIQLVMVVGLICGINGAIKAGNAASKPPYTIQTQTLSKVSSILFVISWVATVCVTVFTAFKISAAEARERRLLFAVSFSLPLLLVRLAYSCTSTFTRNLNFSPTVGNPIYLLCLALIEELIVTVTYEAVGLTLKKVPDVPQGFHSQLGGNESQEPAYQESPQPKQDSAALRMAKRSIIGQLVMYIARGFQPEKQRDVEIQSSGEPLRK